MLVVASLGWLFDTMDQQLFNLARRPAIAELLGPGASPATIAEYSGYATTIFIIGWATGGVYFGILGDRIGRAKTMVYTILLYSLFTGLSVFSVGVWDFSFYRFLTGLGVGGQFAVGVALVAETLPDRARPYALGWLQASSAIGNMMAATVGIILGQMQTAGDIDSAWRAMFLVGSLPALLCIVVFKKLKEPERWQREAKAGCEARVLWRALLGPALALQRHRRHAARLRRRRRPVGHRVLQLRSVPLGAGALEHAAGRGDVLDRHDVAAAERRRVLRHLRVHAPDADASAAGRRSRSRSSRRCSRPPTPSGT